MTKTLNDIAKYSTEKVSSAGLTAETYVTTDNMLQNKKGIVPSSYEPTEEKVVEFKKGDVLISNIRPNLRKIWLADRDGGCNPDVLVIRSRGEVSPKLLYAILFQENFFVYNVAGVKQGSKMPRGNKNHIMRFPIEDFVFEHGREIAEIVAKTQEHIVLNNQKAILLSSVLSLLYDYWFTQFDFPNEEGKPYRQSGGEMVHNDDLDRDIPVGWEVKTLAKLVKLDKEKLPDDTTRPCIDLSVMPEGSTFLNELNTSNAFETSLFKMKEKAILFGFIRPYLHKAGVAPCDGAVAETVYQFLPINDDDYNFALMALTHPRIFDYAMSRKQGTKMPVIKADKLLAYKVPYNAEVAKKFNELEIASTLANAAMENQRLAQLRDYLLPLLMSGQVVVNTEDDEENE